MILIYNYIPVLYSFVMIKFEPSSNNYKFGSDEHKIILLYNTKSSFIFIFALSIAYRLS